MNKPKLEISADFGFSDEELEELKEAFDPIFEVELSRYQELSSEVLEPIIIFFFMEISSGFLKEIGKDIWKLFKKKILKVVVEEKNGNSELEFQVKNGENEIRFKFATNDSDLMDKAIDKFPDALKIAEEKELDYAEFDSEEEEWEF